MGMGTGSAQKKNAGNTREHKGTPRNTRIATKKRTASRKTQANQKQTMANNKQTASKPQAKIHPKMSPKCIQNPPKMLPKASQNAPPDRVLNKIEFSAANSPHFGPQGSPRFPN